MIVECITDTSFRGRPYKKGDQKNVLPDLGNFMVQTGKWKLLGGQVQTDQEKKFFEKLNEPKDPEPVPVKVVEDVSTSRKKKK